MTRLFLGAAVLLTAAMVASAEQPAGIPPEWRWDPAPRQIFFDPAVRPISFDEGAPEETKNGPNGNGESEGPEHIRDNAILVEEASNQEAGVAQHIFNWTHFFVREPLVRSREMAWSYTMELPIGSQKHQFSFTSLYLSEYEKFADGTREHQGGIGDTLLNYRYQLLADDDFLWMAPRATLILPTGDERFGLGAGEVGYQFNLPISRYGERFDYHFNAGFTYIPNVSAPLLLGASPQHDLRAYNLGASVFWKPETYLHFFCEFLFLWADEIDDVGARDTRDLAFLNPGVRYAVCQFDQVEWVIGVSVPVGLTDDSPDIGVIAYMSVEHNFRKKNGCAR
jgi:hypothetical protein